MGFEADWKAAKTQFETETGMNKPAEKGKLLFITWRKGSGLEDAFKALDKVMDSRTTWDDAQPKDYKKWEDAIKEMQKKKEAYMPTLEKAIKDEKGKTDNYRSFKVLKAELAAITARAEQKYQMSHEQWEMKRAKGGKALDKAEQALLGLKTQGGNIKSAAAKATLFCKQVLQDPSPAKYNDGILTAARDLRQNISNINRYVFHDYVDLLMKNKTADLAIIDDDRVGEQIRKMSIYLHGEANAIIAAAKKSGNSPTDASLEKLGTDRPSLPTPPAPRRSGPESSTSSVSSSGLRRSVPTWRALVVELANVGANGHGPGWNQGLVRWRRKANRHDRSSQ